MCAATGACDCTRRVLGSRLPFRARSVPGPTIQPGRRAFQLIAGTTVFPGIMRLMSETSETPTVRSSTATAPVPASTDPAPYIHKTPKVFLLAAWVAIVAGIVFIVAVIFFAGFGLGRHAGHG